ncbi:MAG: hypothetical protein CMF84_00040 [Candidatus Marinimicrobia bacterium]|nr:hypothetical protein [Candidatus Neomarinimicrobiota bacterium]
MAVSVAEFPAAAATAAGSIPPKRRSRNRQHPCCPSTARTNQEISSPLPDEALFSVVSIGWTFS